MSRHAFLGGWASNYQFFGQSGLKMKRTNVHRKPPIYHLVLVNISDGSKKHINFSAGKYNLGVKFSPDSSRVAIVTGTGSVNGSVIIFSSRNGKAISVINQERDGQITGLAFSLDGQTLMTGSWCSIRMWEISTKQLIREIEGYSSMFSPKGRQVCVWVPGGYRFIDLYDGTLLGECKVDGGANGNFTFSLDGRKFAGACRDTTIMLLDIKSPENMEPIGDRELNQLWQHLEEKGRPTPSRKNNFQGSRENSEWTGKSAPAYAAMGRLIRGGKYGVSYIKQRFLGPEKKIQGFDELIGKLDSPKFEDRNAASIALSQSGLIAAPAIRRALTNLCSLEMRHRLENILQEVNEKLKSPLFLRGIQVLEQIGTEEAKMVLKVLAEAYEAVSGNRWIGEASEALQRLQNRKS